MHRYEVAIRWLGNRGTGTSGYRDYGRELEVTAVDKPSIAGSADAVFRGDADRWNPEELLVASLSQCHMLWFLHLAAVAGVVVTDYQDAPVGTATMAADGTGKFDEVVLRPTVTVTDQAMSGKVAELHDRAHERCLIANSINFSVRHEPATLTAGG